MAEIDNLELLLSEIDLLKTELQLQPCLQERAWLDILAIENTYHSNRLEGGSLDQRETEMVIRTGLMLPGKPMAENLAALNHFQAIQLIRDQADEQALLSEELLKQLHRLLARAINTDRSGSYRDQTAILTNGKPAPSPEELASLIADAIHWAHLEGPFLHPMVFAGELCLRLESLKLFPYYNGLCARLALNLILLEEGYPLLNFASDDAGRTAYYTALANTQSSSDNNLWACFIAKQALRTAQNLLARLQKQNGALN
ncbi:Fic family protein [Methylomonas sp. MgM2]